MKHWHLITDNPKLATIFPNKPIVAYKKENSLKDSLVRTKNSFYRLQTTVRELCTVGRVTILQSKSLEMTYFALLAQFL